MTTRIGVLGGGQLGRMMALAGARSDMSFVFLDPSGDCCAAAFGEHIRAEYDDQDALAELASRVDLVTFEFESVPVSVRSSTGEICHHPLTTNLHVNGVLDTSMPGATPELQMAAESISSKIIAHLIMWMSC